MSIFSKIPPKLYDFITSYLLFTNHDNTIVNIIKNHETTKILDVGAGTGRVVLKLKKLFPKKKILGVELEKKLVYPKALDKIKIGNFTDIQINEKFDTILLLDVIHHINKKYQSIFIEKINSILTENGYLIIQEMKKGQFWATYITFLEKY
jgi:2-polyprenyl-3-methyl-5-hydroxy-6-metoxy-1,4-benzoquinol methylase